MRSQPHAGPVRRAFFLALTVAPVALMPLACGQSGPELARVSGTVTYKGKPVPKGTVSFVATGPGNGTRPACSIRAAATNSRPKTPATAPNSAITTSPSISHDEQILDYTPKVPVKVERLIPEKYENPKNFGLEADREERFQYIQFRVDGLRHRVPAAILARSAPLRPTRSWGQPERWAARRSVRSPRADARPTSPP